MLVAITLGTVATVYNTSHLTPTVINYTQLRSIGEASTAQSIAVEGERFIVITNDGAELQAVVTNDALQKEIISLFAGANVPIEFRLAPPRHHDDGFKLGDSDLNAVVAGCRWMARYSKRGRQRRL
ncbi:MAG: hypothetical protein WKF84_29640 [Pyrinomonadaceae bacterium]